MTDLIERLYSMQGMGDVQLKALMDGVGPKGADEIKHLRAELMEQCRLLGMSAEREAKHLAQITALEKEHDALKAWKEEVEKQEPVAWLIDWADEPDLGHYFSESAVDEDSGRSRPLFLNTVPAQSVPEITEGMRYAFYAAVEITREGSVINLDEGIRAALAAAQKQEVK